jgi:hypothetical protein
MGFFNGSGLRPSMHAFIIIPMSARRCSVDHTFSSRLDMCKDHIHTNHKCLRSHTTLTSYDVNAPAITCMPTGNISLMSEGYSDDFIGPEPPPEVKYVLNQPQPTTHRVSPHDSPNLEQFVAFLPRTHERSIHFGALDLYYYPRERRECEEMMSWIFHVLQRHVIVLVRLSSPVHPFHLALHPFLSRR